MVQVIDNCLVVTDKNNNVMYIRSMSQNNLNKALSVVNANIKFAVDSRNPHFKNEYASLPSVLSALTPLLNEQGLIMSNYEFGTGFCNKVTHVESGEFIEIFTQVDIKSPNDFNLHKGQITSLRRIASMALFNGTNSDDDDNGEDFKLQQKVEIKALGNLSPTLTPSVAPVVNTPAVNAATVNTPTVNAPAVNAPTVNTPTVNPTAANPKISVFKPKS